MKDKPLPIDGLESDAIDAFTQRLPIEQAIQLSIAISLKRLADAAEDATITEEERTD